MGTETGGISRAASFVGVLISAILGMSELSLAIPSVEQCDANPDLCARGFGGKRSQAPPQPANPPATPPQMGTLAAPPSSPGTCIKHLFDGAFHRGNVPPSQYYSIAATTFFRTSNPRIYSSPTGLVVQEMMGVVTGNLAMDLAFVPVHLPQGAVIREIAVALHDTNSKENLHVALARSMPDLPGSALLITLESDCVQSPALTTMAATGLAIPFDSKYAHSLKLSVVPAQAPGISAPSPQVSVYAIRIGYTMQ